FYIMREVGKYKVEAFLKIKLIVKIVGKEQLLPFPGADRINSRGNNVQGLAGFLLVFVCDLDPGQPNPGIYKGGFGQNRLFVTLRRSGGVECEVPGMPVQNLSFREKACSKLSEAGRV